MGKRNRLDPKSPDFLKNLRHLVMQEKRRAQEKRAELEKEFWAVRMPTLKGLAEAACGLLAISFDFVAAPFMAMKTEMLQARFFRAVEEGDHVAVKSCIEAGVDVLAEKERAFLTAAYNGDTMVARMLFVHGANPDCHSGLPLVLATICGHEGMARCMLEEMGAGIDTSVFHARHEGESRGSELMALLSPSMAFNKDGRLRNLLSGYGVVETGNDFRAMFAFHTAMRCVVMEMRMGKIRFADGKTLYLDPERQESADAVSAYYRRRKLIPPQCKPIQRI